MIIVRPSWRREGGPLQLSLKFPQRGLCREGKGMIMNFGQVGSQIRIQDTDRPRTMESSRANSGWFEEAEAEAGMLRGIMCGQTIRQV